MCGEYHLRVCVVGALAIASNVHAATLHVPADYPTIQSCIDAAVSGQDECVVAPGTYNELINFLGKAITLRSSDGPEATIIDGTGIGGSVVTCANGEGPDTVLKGFTITGGTGTDIGGLLLGGGMYNDGAHPTVADCAFRKNTADYGGGMICLESSPKVTDCTFDDNSAIYSGGGMYNYQSTSMVDNCRFSDNTAGVAGGIHNIISSPTISNCTFRGNTASVGDGGGMVNYYYSSPTVTHCTFSGNTAARTGGGTFTANNCTVTVDHCTLIDNSASQGGGMFNFGGDQTVTDCIFRENSARGGGGMFNYEGTLTIANCTFTGNTACDGYNGLGGGMLNNLNRRTKNECADAGNPAGDYFSGFGGGILSYRARQTLTHCTFFGNTATFAGGGISNESSILEVSNSILRSDHPNEIRDDSNARISFTDLQDGPYAGAIDGGGNIDSDSLFVVSPSDGGDGWGDDPSTLEVDEGANDDNGDLRLLPGSPCINTGDPNFVLQPGETDLDGHSRVLCGRVDMGAYEFGIGDYDCNQVVNLSDFANWSACASGPLPDALAQNASPLAKGGYRGVGPLAHGRGSENACEAFDFDGDGDVDLADFAQFEFAIH